MTYLKLAAMVLKEASCPLNPSEIWSVACEKGYHKYLSSIGKTPASTIGARIYVDIKKKQEQSIFKQISKSVFTLNEKVCHEEEFYDDAEYMDSKMTFLDLAAKVLSQAKLPLTAGEIWNVAQDNAWTEDCATQGKTPKNSLAAVLYMESKKAHPRFIRASEGPTTWWLKEREHELNANKNQLEGNIQQAQERLRREQAKRTPFHERDLHPLLVRFLDSDENFRLSAKTIYHERCSKQVKGLALWNYPDIVGVRFPNLSDVTSNLLSNINQGSYRFYSFELKTALTFSTLKESYFQAVSNSSWANEGYLVVFEDIEKEVRDELKRLNQSFGIGVIQLDSTPEESEIILPARSRNLDIETLNMLVKDSPDFQNFVKEISGHIAAKHQKLGDIPIKSDDVFDDDRLAKHILNHQIFK